MPDPLRPSGERAEKGLGWRLKPGTLPSEAAALLVLSLRKDALCHFPQRTTDNGQRTRYASELERIGGGSPYALRPMPKGVPPVVFDLICQKCHVCWRRPQSSSIEEVTGAVPGPSRGLGESMRPDDSRRPVLGLRRPCG